MGEQVGGAFAREKQLRAADRHHPGGTGMLPVRT